MQIAGSRSWRFEHDDLDVLHRALFVRDAARLPVPASAQVPPPLTGDVPASSVDLSAAAMDAAAGQWLGWWHQMLGQAVREVDVRRGEDPAQGTGTHMLTRLGWRSEVCDPPDFRGLSQTPELRAAATATEPAYRAWSAGQANSATQESFPWLVVNDAVHDVAASLGVPVGEIDGVAHVVDVEGRWSLIAGPRCGVCSVATSADPGTAGRFLRDLFSSGFIPGASA